MQITCIVNYKQTNALHYFITELGSAGGRGRLSSQRARRQCHTTSSACPQVPQNVAAKLVLMMQGILLLCRWCQGKCNLKQFGCNQSIKRLFRSCEREAMLAMNSDSERVSNLLLQDEGHVWRGFKHLMQGDNMWACACQLQHGHLMYDVRPTVLASSTLPQPLGCECSPRGELNTLLHHSKPSPGKAGHAERGNWIPCTYCRPKGNVFFFF